MRLFSYLSTNTSASQTSEIGIVKSARDSMFFPLSALVPDVPSGDMTSLLASGRLDEIASALSKAPANALKPLSEVQFLPLVPRPGKIICLGVNYADHAKEGGHAKPDYPSFFMRCATSQVAHGANILRPKVSTKLDFEAELAVIIGKRGRYLTRETALMHVAGYSCYNDASLRDYQRKTTQWTIGKNFDSTGGFGPWLVTADELPLGATGLRIQSRLNGQIMQDANTRDFIVDVAGALCLLSECMTLEPGDVIITGTPGGVGYARNPPVFMAHGDRCEIEIEGIGILSNAIADAA